MNLNNVFPIVLEKGSDAKLNEFMTLSLTKETIIEELKRTKRYDRLPFLVNFLDLGTCRSYRKDFDEIFGKAAAENDMKSCKHIWKSLKVHLNGVRIAYRSFLTLAEKYR